MPLDRSHEAVTVEPVARLVGRLSLMELDAARPGYDVQAASATIEALFAAIGSEDITDEVELAVRNGTFTFPQAIAVLEIATWSGRENGASLERALEHALTWTEGRLRVALALGHARSVYPFLDRAAMESALTRVAEIFPGHAERCAELIRARRALKHG